MRRNTPLCLALMITALAAGASCSGGGGDRREVSALEFTDPDAPPAASAPLASPVVDRAPAGDPAPPRAVAVVGAPSRTTPAGGAPARPLEPLVIDQMIGQINGNPVYADEFFEPMDARLREEASRLSERQFLRGVRDDVGRQLWDRTRDELLLAEFQTSLTPEQRVGVLAFVEDIRKNLESLAGGSSVVAEEQLLESEGVSLREKVQSVAERQFILEQLRATIASRVQVSFRDIRHYYEQNIDRYQPLPIAVFRVIRAPTADTARLARIEDALASGEPFDEIAARESRWAVDNENRHEVPMEDRDFAKTQYFAGALDEPSRQLTPGARTDRIDLGRSSWWIHLEEIREQPGQSLYDVQLQIEDEIRGQRVRAEETRYFASLMERSNVSDFDTMVRRLVQYAAERYLIQGKAMEEMGEG